MRTISAVPAVLVLFVWSAAAQDAPAPTTAGAIPPVQRMERHFQQGAAFLRGLPEGTQVQVSRADGVNFTLTLAGGKFATRLSPAQLSADKTVLTTPLGYKIRVGADSPPGTVIQSPHGNWTSFVMHGSAVAVTSSSGTMWSSDIRDPLALRLSDATRIDVLDTGKRWEVITLLGERFRLDTVAGTWTVEDPIPSPPLVPDVDTLYAAGNGDSWRKPGQEEHLVFAWNWYSVGFTVAQAIEDVRTGFRRNDLDSYFVQLAHPQDPADMGGALLGRRLALTGGDRMTFLRPGAEPVTVFVLPGPVEPDYFPLKDTMRLRDRSTLPRPN